MVYNSPYQVTQPNYQVPYMSQTYQPQAPQNSSNTITWVQGLGGAKAYPVGAGLSVVLFDSETERFYIKTTDQSGMPQPLRVFDYVERSETDAINNTFDTSNFVTRDEFESAISKLKKQNSNRGGNSNGKSLVRRTAEDDEQ